MHLRSAIQVSTLVSAIFVSAINADPLHSELTPGSIDHNHETIATSLSGMGGSVFSAQDGKIGCRMATKEETAEFNRRNLSVPLHYLKREASSAVDPNTARTLDGAQTPQTGLKILLRGTDQLENHPQAKQAFDKAAQKWEALIDTPITVVVDVDFGSERFGIPYSSPNILGSTFSQEVYRPDNYREVRKALIKSASSSEEASLYARLPEGEVLTDLGPTDDVYFTSAVLRALGLLSAVADPEKEQASLGEPPNIGFNASFNWDFNPDDGIESDKIDFVGVAVHEIGHLLGFTSFAGGIELQPQVPPLLTALDLYRLIPGAGVEFTNAPRVLSSGGDQVFYAGEARRELSLSTGRPDSSGGDGRQASHWKDNELTGEYIGDMDPTVGAGERRDITANDLLALDRIGYTVSSR